LTLSIGVTAIAHEHRDRSRRDVAAMHSQR